MTCIRVENAVFGYAGRPVVHIRELALHPGRCMGMFGPNGSGKTTLVRGVSGLLAPMRGKVERTVGLRIGYLQQHRAMELHWPMTALDAAALAVSARARFGWMSRGAIDIVRRSMGDLEVDDLASRGFASLSGGQQQRVLLAGALAAEPQLLILDEPTEGLDVRSRRILIRRLREAAANGLSTIMISHAIDDLAALSDEVAWVHEAADAGEPNPVEVVPVSALLERVTAMRQSA